MNDKDEYYLEYAKYLIERGYITPGTSLEEVIHYLKNKDKKTYKED